MTAKRGTPRGDADTGRRRVFGDRLRDLRHQRGWTQERLAEATGLDRSFLADVERGARFPGLDTCWRIADGLGITLGELFDGL
jgi:transcriptional regulator with XRE-family HTH domain